MYEGGGDETGFNCLFKVVSILEAFRLQTEAAANHQRPTTGRDAGTRGKGAQCMTVQQYIQSDDKHSAMSGFNFSDSEDHQIKSLAYKGGRGS